MNQDSSFPPMLPPSTELGALLFAVLPCLQETYRPLASFAYHMTELTRLKSLPSVPPLSGLSGIDALITDKDIMLRSLSFYGKLFHMPLLSTVATLFQGMHFYQTYKDILPGLFSGMGNSGTDPSSLFGNMSGLFSGLNGTGGFGSANTSEASGPDLFSLFGGLSPELLSSLFTAFSGGVPSQSTGPSATSAEATGHNTKADSSAPTDSAPSSQTSEPTDPDMDISEQVPTEPATSSSAPTETFSPSDDLYDNLYSFLTPEQQKIYDRLMHTD